MKTECETKHKLLDTAVELIWENSYGSVSVDDICKRSGVKKGSFYHFFPSKTDLTVAALESHWQEKRPVMDRIFSSQATFQEKLSSLVEYIYLLQKNKQAEFGKVCGCPYISIGSELGTLDEKIRSKSAELMERVIRYYESLVRDGQSEGLIARDEDPKVLAREVYSFVLGQVMQARLLNDLTPLEAILPGIQRLLGLRAAVAVREPALA